MRGVSRFCGLLMIAWCGWPIAAYADGEVIAGGLVGPVKVELTARGNLLVTETDTGVNDGRLTFVNRSGGSQSLLEGLPSGIAAPGDASGPTALIMHGCCVVDVAIGEGDTLRFGTPPAQVPNPVGPVSPLFSSVVQLVFDHAVDSSSGGFALASADQQALADGEVVRLANAAGQRVWMRLIADLKDFRGDPITNVRASNPFGMAPGRGIGNPLVIADAGANSVVQLRWLEPPRTVLRFAPVASGGFPPFSDAVPTAVRYFGGSKYLVSLLVGVPFAPGTSSVRLVDVASQTQTELITGLTSATDVLAVGSGFYVLEISGNLGQGLPGQLLHFTSPTALPTVVASDLIGPTGMAYARRQQAIYIAENFAGLIRRIDL